MAIQIQKATKRRAKLRLAFDGPSGSGKTYTSLAVACAIAKALGGRVGVIDTERGSASLYADEFDFDVVELQDFAPDRYVEAIKEFEAAGHVVIVADSLSHAWEGKGGALDMKDRAATKGGNDWTAWRSVTPAHNRLVDAMLQSTCHVIATMRTKMEYVQEKDVGGKTVIRKVGMAPIQRNGMEYEFTVVGDLDYQHVLTISKTRCKKLDNEVIARPGEPLAKLLLDWLQSGAEPLPPLPAAPASEAAPTTQTTTQKPAALTSAPKASTASPAQPSGTAPSPASPVRAASDLAGKLRAAKSLGELNSVADSIAASINAGNVNKPERDQLSDLYAECKEKLAPPASAPAQSEPVNQIAAWTEKLLNTKNTAELEELGAKIGSSSLSEAERKLLAPVYELRFELLSTPAAEKAA